MMEFSITFTIPDWFCSIFKFINSKRIIILLIIIPFITFMSAFTKSTQRTEGTLNTFRNGDIISSQLINENFTLLNETLNSIYATDINSLVSRIAILNTSFSQNWAQYDERLLILNAGAVPSKIIVMWYNGIGAIPYGWKICDGTEGTPDLRGRSIIGSSADDAASLESGFTFFLHKNKDNPVHSHKYPHAHSTKTNVAPTHSHIWLNDEDDNGVWYSYNSVGNPITSVMDEVSRDPNFSGSGFIPLENTTANLIFYTSKTDNHKHDLTTSDPTQELTSGTAGLKPPLYPFYYIMKE